MTAKEYLFVGGPIDGERRAVDGGRPLHRICVLDNPGHALGEPVTFHAVDYRIMAFSGNKERFKLFVLEGMTADEVIQRLIEGYKGAPDDR